MTATDDGGAAWEVLQKPEAPRLAILDLMMPGIDGLELVRRVRAIPSVAPPYLIIVSTKSEKSDVIAALDAGANDYLTKPFDPGELRARIEVGRRMIEMRFELNEKVKELKQALAEVRTLKGIVPICANCKNVRDDQGYWNRVESYLNEHTEADFTPRGVSRLHEAAVPAVRRRQRRQGREETLDWRASRIRVLRLHRDRFCRSSQ